MAPKTRKSAAKRKRAPRNHPERRVYINGDFVPEREAKVSIYDSALMYGDCLFEMMRTFNKKHFRVRDHLERLYAGIRILRIPVTMSIDEMEDAYYQTVEVNAHHFTDPDEEMRPLIDVTRGILSVYRHIFGGKAGEPLVIIAIFPLKWTVGHMARFFGKGVHTVVVPQRAIPADLLDPKMKNRSRLHYQMANIQAALVSPEAWALLLDPDGFIAEGSGANVFIVKDGAIATPEPRNILRGVSRGYVIELASELGIPIRETNLQPYEAETADEIFFTSTPYCIMPATKINGLTVGNGKPGPVTMRLLKYWGEKVGVDIVAQAKRYGKQITRVGKRGEYVGLTGMRVSR